MLSQNIVDIYKMHRLKFSDANSGTWRTQETQQGSVASAPGPRQQQRNTKSTRRQHLTRCAGCVASFSPLSTSLTLVGVVLGTARRVAIHESGRGFDGGPWQTVRYRAFTWGNQSSRNVAGAYG